MTNADIYRPNSNKIFAGIGFLLSAFFLWSSFYQGGAASEATSTCVALFVALCIYIFLVRPKVSFYDEGVIITNPIETITIGWADVVELDSKWAFAIETKGFTVSAWAATAPGRHHSRNIHTNEIKGLGVDLDGNMRVADSPHSDSGATIYRAKIRLQKFRNAGGANSLPTQRVREIKPLIAAGAFLLAAILINIFGH